MYATLALSALAAAVPAVLAQSTGTGECTDVHIFIARGWNEEYPGRQGKLTSAICADLPGKSCDYEDIQFDAASTDFCPNVQIGEANGLKQINDYYSRCPNSALVVSGYSEGAQIVGDILAGGGGSGHCADFTGLPYGTGASCNIAAALVFGDPRHTANQAYNVLDGAAGQADDHRTAAQLAILNNYTPRLHSYCNHDDLICAKGLGADTVDAHTNYFDKYTEDAASWAAGVVTGWSKNKYCAAPSSSSSSNSASTTPSSSGSISASVPISSHYGNASFVASTSSVAIATVTDVTSIYTTICPQSSLVVSQGTTSTSTWVGPSTVTSVVSSAITTTVPGSYVPTSSIPAAKTTATTIGGKPAVVSYSAIVSTTTYGNFPPITITKPVAVATSYAGSFGWTNGTLPTTLSGVPAPSGTGVWGPGGSPKPSAGVTPFTGAASNVAVAGWLAGVVGVVGMMLL